MEKILISACLLGAKVRYNGTHNQQHHPLLLQWQKENRLISVCPEVKGGATVPREAAEIVGFGGGKAVLKNLAKICNQDGTDVTELYKNGAMGTLSFAKMHHVKIAILKEDSPSCGSSQIYDGTFSNVKITQSGVTTALLRQNGITVFNEDQIDEAAQYLEKIELRQDCLPVI